MSRHSVSMKLVCSVGLVGLLTMAPGARTGSAQSVNDMVRTLNNIVNPNDAQRLEDQARRNGRVQEERYWRDYRAGLDSPDRNRRDYGPDDRGGPDYRGPDYRGPDYRGPDYRGPDYRGGGDYRGRSDYRNQRDEGYSRDSDYRRGYPDQRDYRYDQR